MKNKFLHVLLIVVSMAVICCVSAFAEMPYPDDLPPVPGWVSDYSYLVCLRDDEYVFAYTDLASSVLFIQAEYGPCVYVDNAGVPVNVGVFVFRNSSWTELYPYEPRTGPFLYVNSLLYANYDVYDFKGNLVYAGAPAPPPPPPDPYENFWSDLKDVGTGVLGWAGNVASTITEEPVLLFTVGIFILGAAIGIFRRLLVRG